MDIIDIAFGAKSCARKNGEHFDLDEGERFSPRGYNYKKDDLEIKIWSHPYDSDKDAVEVKFYGKEILKYDPDYPVRDFYESNSNFENYFAPIVAQALLEE